MPDPIDDKDPGGANLPDPADPGKKPDDKPNDPVALAAKNAELLKEKKKLQEERDALKADKDKADAAIKEAERKKLEENGNLQGLLKLEKEENAATKAELKEIKDGLQRAKKESAVLRHINGKVDPDVVDALLKVDGVVVNEDGSVDQDTAKAVAQLFEKKYPFAVLRDKKNGGLPNNAAGGDGGGTKVPYDVWKKMNAKDQEKNYGNVAWPEPTVN